ncbi:MAG: Rrf2 family transcriptional regulator [Akkermansia sp.]
MIDLAQHNDDGYISLKEISARQDITVRYLEQIIAILLKAGFVQSFREVRRLPPVPASPGIHHGRHPETDGRLPAAPFLPASQNSPCPRASSRHAFLAGLERSLRITWAASRWRTCPSKEKEIGRDYGAGI